MLDALRKLLGATQEEEAQTPSFVADDTQLAEAALMFHVIAVDGIVDDEEREQLSHVLSSKYGLSPSDAEMLIAEARQADNEAIDLYAFTRTLKRQLDSGQRLQVIRNLWEMVYADGVVHELEDNIVWRVAELLDVDARDRMEIKRAVRSEQGEAE